MPANCTYGTTSTGSLTDGMWQGWASECQEHGLWSGQDGRAFSHGSLSPQERHEMKLKCAKNI